MSRGTTKKKKTHHSLLLASQRRHAAHPISCTHCYVPATTTPSLSMISCMTQRRCSDVLGHKIASRLSHMAQRCADVAGNQYRHIAAVHSLFAPQERKQRPGCPTHQRAPLSRCRMHCSHPPPLSWPEQLTEALSQFEAEWSAHSATGPSQREYR